MIAFLGPKFEYDPFQDDGQEMRKIPFWERLIYFRRRYTLWSALIYWATNLLPQVRRDREYMEEIGRYELFAKHEFAFDDDPTVAETGELETL